VIHVVISKAFEFKNEDFKKSLYNALVFLAPVLVVAIPALAKQIPAEVAYGSVILYVLNFVTDLLKKFIQENKYK